METKLYLRMLKQGWWIILLTALTAVLVSLIISYFTTPIYLARARFSVSPNNTVISQGEVLSSLDVLDKRSIVATYAEFLNSPRIFSETAESLKLDPKQTAKDYRVNTVVLPDANILDFTVEGPDARLTSVLANQVGARAIEYIRRLYQVYDITLLDPAAASEVPIRPVPLRDGLLALGLGLVLGAALALVREQVRAPLDAYRLRNSLDPDSLAFNRATFHQKMEDEMTREGGQVSVGLVQLNSLRGLLEALPEGMTQDLLRKVTDVLRRELRGNDIVGRYDQVVFSVMLPGTPKNAASMTLDRIRAALSRPITLEQYGETLYLGPAVSVATQEGSQTVSDLLEAAERGLEQRPRT